MPYCVQCFILFVKVMISVLSSVEVTFSHLHTIARADAIEILFRLNIGDCMPNHCKIFRIKDHHTPKNTPSPNSIKRKHPEFDKEKTSQGIYFTPENWHIGHAKIPAWMKIYKYLPYIWSHWWNFLPVVILVKPGGVVVTTHSTAASICFTKRQGKRSSQRTDRFRSGGRVPNFDAREIFFWGNQKGVQKAINIFFQCLSQMTTILVGFFFWINNNS